MASAVQIEELRNDVRTLAKKLDWSIEYAFDIMPMPSWVWMEVARARTSMSSARERSAASAGAFARIRATILAD